MEQRLPAGSFFGSVDRRFEVTELILSETLFASGHDIPLHEHENAYFRFTLQGRSTDTTGKRTFHSKPGTMLFHPAAEPHANRWSEDGGRSFNIELTASWLDRVGTCVPAIDGPLDFTGGMPVWVARRIYKEFRERDSLSHLAIEGLVLQLLTEVFRRPQPGPLHAPPAWLPKVKRLLNVRFAQSPSLGDLAAAVGVHPDYLSSAFRKQYGVTVGDYLRKRRIEYACRQLAAAEMSLADIALEAGFCDQSHFTRTFRRLMGTTPREYRASLTGYKPDTNE